MKRKVYSKILALAALGLFGAVSTVGVVSFQNRAVETKAEFTSDTTSVTRMKVHYNAWLFFYFDNFDSGTTASSIDNLSKISECNFLTNIYVDDDPTKLAINTTSVQFALTGANNSLAVTPSALIKGGSFRKIVIPAGTSFPAASCASGTYKKYVTEEEIIFYNMNHSGEANFLTHQSHVKRVATTVEMFGNDKPNPGWPGFKLSNNDFATDGSTIQKSQITNYLNLSLAGIQITAFDGATHSLTDVISGAFFASYNEAASGYVSFGLKSPYSSSWNDFQATKIIYVPKGTEFPSREWATNIANETGDKTIYYTTEDAIFYCTSMWGDEYKKIVPEFVDNTIDEVSGHTPFEMDSKQYTNLCFEVDKFNVEKKGANTAACSSLCNLTTCEFYDAEGTRLYLTNASNKIDYVFGNMFADFNNTNDYLMQIQTDALKTLAKIVFKKGTYFPSPACLQGTSNVWYRLPADQTFYLHNNRFVEKTTVKFGEEAAQEWYRFDKLGTLPAVPAHAVDPDGKITYTGYWKDQDGNRVTAETVVTKALVLTPGYDESATIYTVTYKDEKGAAISELTTQLAWNAKDNALPAVPEKTGYTGHWESTDVSLSDGKFDMIVGNVTINAVYEANKYQLSFGEGISPIEVTYGQAIGTLPTIEEKEGFHYTGWYIGEDLITAETVWDYTENKSASVDYEAHEFGAWTNHSDTQHVRECDCGKKEYGNHDWNINVVWTENSAKASAECKVCGATIEETKKGSYVLDTPATCHSYETGHYEVTFDDTRLGSDQTEPNSVTNTEAPKPGHDYGETTYDWTMEEPVSCVGSKSCENEGCEDKVVENAEISYEVIDAPTCTNKGLGRYTATFATLATTTKDVEIPATGHSEELVEGKVATCKEDGYKDCYYCEDCATYYEDEDCTQVIGNQAAYEAWILGDGKLAKEDVEHTPAEEPVIENVVSPTCTEAGSHDEVIYCEVCGKELSRTPVVDPALGHDMETVQGKDATCKEDGYKACFYCSTCEKYFEDQEGDELIGDAVAYAAWILDEGKLAKEDVEHTPAAAVKENEVAATCTKDGSYDSVVYCSVCGKELSREKVVVKALGHDWGKGVVTKAATCTEDGVMTYTCSRCGEKKTEVIKATGHKLGELVAEVAATTEKEGMKAHYVCSVCGKYFDANKNECTKESLVIAKLEKKGCGGSVIAASAIVTGLAIAGAALIAAKKKED